MKKLLVVVLIILAAIAVFFIAKPLGDDLDGLGGEPWVMAGMEENGRKVPQKEWAGMKVQFIPKETVIWTIRTKEGLDEAEGGFGYNAAKKPKEIDLNHPFAERASPGIYKIEDGELVICIGARRPAEFSGKGTVKFTFKRG